jgi:hypothetical protein
MLDAAFPGRRLGLGDRTDRIRVLFPVMAKEKSPEIVAALKRSHCSGPYGCHAAATLLPHCYQSCCGSLDYTENKAKNKLPG